MIRKVPIIDSALRVNDLVYALSRAGAPDIFTELESAIAKRVGMRCACLTDSGITALYLILKALAASSKRTEVVLPAYTAGSLVVAVRKAGLKPVLCDISLKDFNSDVGSLTKAVSEKTVAVICVHMFGVPMAGIVGLKRSLPAEVTIIEDCAQAMGSSIGGNAVGGFGDVSFFSFNRGKNLPVCGGGCITTNDGSIYEAVKAVKKSLLPGHRGFDAAGIINVMAFAAAVHPYIYGMFFRIISRFKETSPPVDFEPGSISGFHAALALSLLGRFDAMAATRNRNGSILMNGLRDLKGIALPVIGPCDKCAFNRFPIVFTDRMSREAAEYRISRRGLESSRMYLRPLHHIFDLGYRMEDFPNAVSLAQGLVTLPAHPSVRAGELAKAIEAIRGVRR